MKIKSALLILFSLFSITSCTRDRDENSKSVRVAIHSDLQTLDPAIATDATTWRILSLVYEPLYQYAYLSNELNGEPKVVPLLAADYPTVSPDHLTVTIRLRPDVYFQNDSVFTESNGKGRMIKASDVVASWKRVADAATKSPYRWIFSERITEFFAKDDFTIEIKLASADPQFLHLLTLPPTSVMPPEALQKTVGTGPFLLKKWEKGFQLEFTRNPTYHPDFYPTEGSPAHREKGFLADAGKTLPFAEGIVFKIIREPSMLVTQMNRGRIDLTRGPTLPNDSAKFKNTVAQYSIEPAVTFFEVNSNDPVLKNKDVRHAIAFSIHRDNLIENAFSNRAVKATTFAPPGYQDRIENYPMRFDYDPEKAKQLLTAAGYSAETKPLSLQVMVFGTAEQERKMGEILLQQFAATGIQAHFFYETEPSFSEKIREKKYQVALYSWMGDHANIESVYERFLNENTKEWVTQIRQYNSGENRTYLGRKIEDALHEDAFWIPLFYPKTEWLSLSRLINFYPAPFVWNAGKYYRIEMK